MGWDGDKSGDYVPRPVPCWLSIALGIALLGFLALLLLASG